MLGSRQPVPHRCGGARLCAAASKFGMPMGAAPVGAHNSVVGADQGFRAPSGDQESVRDWGHEDSASAPIAAGQRPRPSFRHPQDAPQPPTFVDTALESKAQHD